MSGTERIISPVRRTGLSGQITYLTGQTRLWDGERAVSFSCTSGVQDGILLGGALSGSFQLTLDNADGYFTFPHTPYGAQVRVCLTENGESTPIGVFTVSGMNSVEETGRLTLSGADAMGTAFEAEWVDDLYYPMTLGALAQALAGRVGFTCRDAIPGRAQIVYEAPDWGEITVRRALSYVMQAGGSFAVIDGSGALRFLPAWPSAVAHTLAADGIFRRVLGDGAFGPLKGVSVMPWGARRDTEPVIAQEAGAALSGQNCLYLSGNPLFTASGAQTMAQSLYQAVQGLTLTRAQVHWAGDPALRLGDRMDCEGADESAFSTQVTRQTLQFDQGFSMQSDCTVGRSVSSVGRLVTPSGALNASMLQGEVNGAHLMADTVAASAIIAGSITATQLAASAVTADKLAADVGEMMEARIQDAHIRAAQIDDLENEMIRTAQAQISEAHIEAAQVDDLNAAVALVSAAQISTASIAFSQLKDAVTQNLITKDALADRYYIRKLQVDNLQSIALTTNNLVVGAANGDYYALSVDDEGAVTATLVTVTDAEIAAGVTADGQRSIIATDLLASELSADNIKGANALLDKITARRINVDALFAREAFMGKLITTDISGNGYLRAMVDGKIENVTLGGRNYLRGSADLDYAGYYVRYAQGDPATGAAVTGVTRLPGMDHSRTDPYIGYGEIDYAELED